MAESDAELGALPPPAQSLEGMRFGPGHIVVIDEAAEALASGRAFPVTGEDGRAAVALVERVVAAARQPTTTGAV